MKKSIMEKQEKKSSPAIKKQEKVKKPSPVKEKLNLYLFQGHGILWDRARNKALCRFQDGKLLTTDVRIIAILLKKRFRYKTKHPVAKEVLNETYKAYKKEIDERENQLGKVEFDRKTLSNMRISELRILSKAKKIRVLQVTSKDEMINHILGARG